MDPVPTDRQNIAADENLARRCNNISFVIFVTRTTLTSCATVTFEALISSFSLLPRSAWTSTTMAVEYMLFPGQHVRG